MKIIHCVAKMSLDWTLFIFYGNRHSKEAVNCAQQLTDYVNSKFDSILSIFHFIITLQTVVLTSYDLCTCFIYLFFAGSIFGFCFVLKCIEHYYYLSHQLPGETSDSSWSVICLLFV